MRMPKKSKSGKHYTLGHRLSDAFPRFFAFMLDWASWGYVAYGVMYLLNKYWYVRHVNFYGTLTLPVWGWPVVIISTFELALISHVLGQSIGLQMRGLRLYGPDYTSPTLSMRLRRWATAHLVLIAQPFAVLFGSRKPGLLLHDRDATGYMVDVYRTKDDLPFEKPTRWYQTYRGLFIVFLLSLTFWLGWKITTINLRMLIDRISKSGHIWKDLVTPNFSYLTEDVIPGRTFSILYYMLETMFMAFFATVSGAIVAFPLSFLGARNIMGFNAFGWVIYSVMRTLFNALRSIESILMAVMFAVWVGFGNPFAGAMALFLHTIAALAKLYSEQVEAVDKGPLEAMAATGARRWQIVIYGVIPQIIPSFLAFTLYRWDINIRMATVIALVGGGGIGTLLFYFKNEVGRLDDAWNQVGAVIVAIIIVVWVLDYISARVREKIG